MLAVIALVATAILPGTGHLLLRRYLRGATMAVLYTASADLLLISTSPYLAEGKMTLRWVCIAVMAGVWIYALIDVIRHLNSRRSKELRTRKDDLLRSAQICWLKEELPEAERILTEILGLDERDVEAWVLLGKVYRSSGKDAEARRCFRSAVNLAGSEQWRWMLMKELGSTDESPAGIPLP